MKLFLLTILFPVFAFSAPSLIKNKKLLNRFYKEVYVDWKMETADEMLSPDFVSHDWQDNLGKGPKRSGIIMQYLTQTVTLKGVAIYRVENNKLVERWVVSDLYELLKNIKEQSKK